MLYPPWAYVSAPFLIQICHFNGIENHILLTSFIFDCKFWNVYRLGVTVPVGWALNTNNYRLSFFLSFFLSVCLSVFSVVFLFFLFAPPFFFLFFIFFLLYTPPCGWSSKTSTASAVVAWWTSDLVTPVTYTLHYLLENVNVQSSVLYWLTRAGLSSLLFQYLVSLGGLEWKRHSHSSDLPGPDCYFYYSSI